MKINKYSKKMMKNIMTGRGCQSGRGWTEWTKSIEVGDIVSFGINSPCRVNGITGKSFKIGEKWIRKRSVNSVTLQPCRYGVNA